MRAIFVAGTDTGVGKTVVTGLLGRHLLEKGYRVATQKWIQTGGEYSQDIDTHLKLMKKRIADYDGHISSMTPYVFRFASSPHLAARLENRRIKISRIERSFKELSRCFDVVIVEGSGGLLVPIGENRLMIDIVRRLRLPVLLVAENRIGAINSSLLSVEALRSRKMRLAGIIFNNAKNENALILRDNPKIVRRLSGVNIAGILPYASSEELLYKRFAPIGGRIEKLI